MTQKTLSHLDSSALNYQSVRFYNPDRTPTDKAARKSENRKALISKNARYAFQTFTGRGGLHGLRWQNFPNFAKYSGAKRDFEMGQFFTPDEVCQTVIEMLEIEQEKTVADICSGKGSFFNYLKGCRLYGVEKDFDAWKISKRAFPEAHIQNVDMRQMRPIPACDYIVGNPPFSLHLPYVNHPLGTNNKVVSQDFHLYKCWQCLKDGGFIGLVVPHFRGRLAKEKTHRFFLENFRTVAIIILPSGIFPALGKGLKTKILVAQKKSNINQSGISIFKTTFQNRSQVLNEWRNSLQYLEYNKMKQDFD